MLAWISRQGINRMYGFFGELRIICLPGLYVDTSAAIMFVSVFRRCFVRRLLQSKLRSPRLTQAESECS
jgi:hypothetical protein